MFIPLRPTNLYLHRPFRKKKILYLHRSTLASLIVRLMSLTDVALVHGGKAPRLARGRSACAFQQPIVQRVVYLMDAHT